ncbi:hypothetical protein [Leptospira interrogans]|uniref:hypothetical protein n=1 Tax=Leptospira interrogans TaxID=173 RepID=UPI0009E551B6|nr:hypothetical protein [Leptospira interrogans]QCO32410.1 hypothetical protein E4414_04465 [Leptospira interrogans]ULG78792.1 hypothetical protein FH597_08790 [Leptospira interrogans]UMQ53394.1 hypothetical protein FH582_15805 [Leptospira interrogans]
MGESGLLQVAGQDSQLWSINCIQEAQYNIHLKFQLIIERDLSSDRRSEILSLREPVKARQL